MPALPGKAIVNMKYSWLVPLVSKSGLVFEVGAFFRTLLIYQDKYSICLVCMLLLGEQ